MLSSQAQGSFYWGLSCMAFINRYLFVMALQPESIKPRMFTHLQEMMEDGEVYRWPVVLSYHAAWLQHLEQGWATWEDEATTLKLRRALVWHQLPPPQTPTTSSQPTRQQPAADKVQSKTGPFSEPVKPGDRACTAFNKGLCVTLHPADLHVCCYCLFTIQRLCHHMEQFCRCKDI